MKCQQVLRQDYNKLLGKKRHQTLPTLATYRQTTCHLFITIPWSWWRAVAGNFDDDDDDEFHEKWCEFYVYKTISSVRTYHKKSVRSVRCGASALLFSCYLLLLLVMVLMVLLAQRATVVYRIHNRSCCWNFAVLAEASNQPSSHPLLPQLHRWQHFLRHHLLFAVIVVAVDGGPNHLGNIFALVRCEILYLQHSHS